MCSEDTSTDEILTMCSENTSTDEILTMTVRS